MNLPESVVHMLLQELLLIFNGHRLYNVSHFSLFCLSFFQVDLLKGQRSDRVDVTLQPEELELMDNVLPAK